MTRITTLGVGIGFFVVALIIYVPMGSPHAIAQNGPRLDVEFDIQTGTLSWNDLNDEAAYRVSGIVSYLLFNCPPEEPLGEGIAFDEELPADTTSFQLPLPQDERLVGQIKEVSLRLEALDPAGEMFVLDGYGLTVDGFFCPPQSGVGMVQSPPSWLSTTAYLLIVLGTISFFGGLILRRSSRTY